MKIVVLGGHGFLGTNICEILSKSNHVITPLSRRNGLDLTDYECTSDFFNQYKPDIILNCAANVGSLNYVTKEAANVLDDNIRILINIYKAAYSIVPNSLLLNPIANCAYPGNIDVYEETKFWDGKVHQSVIAYGNSRRFSVILSECYFMQHGYKTINFFVPNMYGPHDSTDPNKAHALNALISKVVKLKKLNQGRLEVWGSGIAIREWLYVLDCARFCEELINNLSEPGIFEPINIGQNYGLSIRELVDIIIQETSFQGYVEWNRDMPEGMPRKVMDDARFKKIFPDFKFTDLRSGIRNTIKYYESVYPY